MMSLPLTDRLANILLVEDSQADTLLFSAKMQAEHIRFNFCSVRDGEEALEFLNRQGEFADAFSPDLVFLDINLPKMSGLELLEHIKKKPELNGIHCVIHSSSESSEDVLRSDALGAACSIVKPLDYEKLKLVLEKVTSLAIEVEGSEKYLVRTGGTQELESGKSHE